MKKLLMLLTVFALTGIPQLGHADYYRASRSMRDIHSPDSTPMMLQAYTDIVAANYVSYAHISVIIGSVSIFHKRSIQRIASVQVPCGFDKREPEAIKLAHAMCKSLQGTKALNIQLTCYKADGVYDYSSRSSGESNILYRTIFSGDNNRINPEYYETLDDVRIKYPHHWVGQVRELKCERNLFIKQMEPMSQVRR